MSGQAWQLRIDGGEDHALHVDSDAQNTPAWIIETAREVMGGIDLDPASNARAQEIIRAARWYGLDRGEDGLAAPWAGRVWCNPPYSSGAIEAFVDKAIGEWQRGEIQRMILLVNASMCSQWMGRLMRSADTLAVPTKRIAFISAATGQARKSNEYDQIALAWGCGRGMDLFARRHRWMIWR